MKKIILSTVFLLSVVFVNVLPARSQVLLDSFEQLKHTAGSSGANLGTPMDPRTIVANIVRLALSLIGTILIVIIVWAGYKWMTAQGNENQIADSKKTIFNATIGLIVIMSAYALTILVTNLASGRKLNSGAGQGGGTLDDAVGSWFR